MASTYCNIRLHWIPWFFLFSFIGLPFFDYHPKLPHYLIHSGLLFFFFFFLISTFCDFMQLHHLSGFIAIPTLIFFLNIFFRNRRAFPKFPQIISYSAFIFKLFANYYCVTLINKLLHLIKCCWEQEWVFGFEYIKNNLIILSSSLVIRQVPNNQQLFEVPTIWKVHGIIIITRNRQNLIENGRERTPYSISLLHTLMSWFHVFSV